MARGAVFLDHPELAAIDRSLDAGDLTLAQHQLANLDAARDHEDAVTYLTTRLLFLRQKLDGPAVADRLAALLARNPDFPEAHALLTAAGMSLADLPPTSTRSVAATAGAPRRPGSSQAFAATQALSSAPRAASTPPPVQAGSRANSENAPATPARAITSGPVPSAPPPSFRTPSAEAPYDLGSGPPRSETPASDWQAPRARSPEPQRWLSAPNFRAVTPEPEPEPEPVPQREPTYHGPRSSYPSPSLTPGGGLPRIPVAPVLPSFDRDPRPPSYAPAERPSSPGHYRVPSDSIPPPESVRTRSSLPPRSPSSLPPEEPDRDSDAGRYSVLPGEIERVRQSHAPRREGSGERESVRPGVGRYSDRPPAHRAERVSVPPGPALGAPGAGPVRRPSGMHSEHPMPRRPVSAPPVAPRRSAPPGSSRSSRWPRVHATPSAFPAPRVAGRSGEHLRRSLSQVGELLERDEARDALKVLEQLGLPEDPSHALLYARALAGVGSVERALGELARIEDAPLLEPSLRAACARAFVEVDELDRALTLSIKALDESPRDPIVRLTFAWAAVRSSRRRDDDWLLDQVERALESLSLTEPEYTALLLALRACVQARIGDPERAIALAQRALAIEQHTPDAIAAVAEAFARLERREDAREALERLADMAPEEATALSRRLRELRVDVRAISDKPAGDAPLRVWVPLEEALAEGKRAEVMTALEKLATTHIRRMTKTASQSGLTVVATVASSFFTTAPILRNFSPFDLSLWSIARVESALDVVYGGEPRPELLSDSRELVMLVGAYLGETLRQAHAGHWNGSITDIDRATVTAIGRTWNPFSIVRDRLRHGRRAPIRDNLGAALANPRDSAFDHRMQTPVSPPSPWDPRPWPRPSDLPRLATALGHSVVALYCESLEHGTLDRSLASLKPLEGYLDLVSPPGASHKEHSLTLRRVAVLVGAYLGEVLRDHFSGEWAYGADRAESADSFRLILSEHFEATPVEFVLNRLTGKTTATLADYARSVGDNIAALGK